MVKAEGKDGELINVFLSKSFWAQHLKEIYYLQMGNS